jgi:hypothetical protein
MVHPKDVGPGFQDHLQQCGSDELALVGRANRASQRKGLDQKAGLIERSAVVIMLAKWLSMPCLNGIQCTVHLKASSSDDAGTPLRDNQLLWFNHPLHFVLKPLFGDRGRNRALSTANHTTL